MKTQNISLNRRSTFGVIFFINRADITRKGTCRVRGRITIDTLSVLVNTKTNVPVKIWDAKAGQATGKSRDALTVNKTISRIKEEIKAAHKECLRKYGYVTAELIKNRIEGIGQSKNTLLKLFEEHNNEYAKRVGVDRKQPALDTYWRTYARLEQFIKKHYADEDLEDIALKRLDQEFIEEFHLYLLDDCNLGEKMILERITHLRKISKRAKNQGTIKIDPFATYHVDQKRSPFRHLTKEEMTRVMEARIDDPILRYTRDLFVFSCFTGLAFIDVCRFSDEHIVIGPDGTKWVKITRGKTGVESNFKLLKIPLAIMEHYAGERKGTKIFNIEYRSRSILTPHMRALEKICNINHITFHMARHNFATHVTLSQGIPITSLKNMMGHTSITTTQVYAEMQEDKLKNDIKGLAERTEGKYIINDQSSQSAHTNAL